MAFDPLNRLALNALAGSNLATGRTADAERQLLANASLYPNFIDTKQSLGDLYIRQGRLDRAEPWLKAAAAPGTDPSAAIQLANLYFNLHMSKQAVAALATIKAPPVAAGGRWCGAGYPPDGGGRHSGSEGVRGAPPGGRRRPHLALGRRCDQRDAGRLRACAGATPGDLAGTAGGHAQGQPGPVRAGRVGGVCGRSAWRSWAGAPDPRRHAGPVCAAPQSADHADDPDRPHARLRRPRRSRRGQPRARGRHRQRLPPGLGHGELHAAGPRSADPGPLGRSHLKPSPTLPARSRRSGRACAFRRRG